MITIKEWNERIDAFIKEENQKAGRQVPVHRIYCQDGTDRSGGGFYNKTVTLDTIGRYARALGDSNPLYSAPEYAKNSIRGDIIAPPLVECCICSTFIGGRMPRLKGLQVYDAGTKWERFAQIRPGDSFSAVTTFLGIEECTKPGKEIVARLLLRSHAIDLTNQRGELVSRLTARSLIRCAAPVLLQEKRSPGVPAKTGNGADPVVEKTMEGSSQTGINTEPAASGSYVENEKTFYRPQYSRAQLEAVYANLDAQLNGDFRRGGDPRYWEDVETGEKLPEEIVGPYDESDGQALMAAIGAANAFATKWGTIRSRRGAGVVIDPETGARRHPIDRHSSDMIARAQGLPRAIVSGIHSQALLAKSVSDWMGDEGFLKSLDCRCKKPLYYGDLSIQRGEVTGRFEEGGRFFAALHLEAVNQDGMVHTDADAIVELPSRKKGI